MRIIIDSREQERGLRAAEYFKDKGHDVIIEELTVGDYLFADKTVFEYKRIDDFFQSLNDNRLWNQAINQYETYDYHYVIVEMNKKVLGKLKKRWKRKELITNNERYDGMVAELNVFTNVIEKETERQCFKSMLKVAEKVCKNKMLIHKPELKTANPAENWLTMVKGVGSETASLISDSCGADCLHDLLRLRKEDLVSIKGIGDKTADVILNSINKMD